ncbi:MAG: Smr/MutS family protein [Sphingomonadaceae bacterium]|nr:Smr/MutS family protein [Sphingomonadaceae bacterium]
MARRLDSQEKALWAKVMATVKPLDGVHPARNDDVTLAKRVAEGSVRPSPRKTASPLHHISEGPAPRAGEDNLNSHWNRRIHRGGIVPDISIDLHDASLSRAYARLDGALEQAIAQKLKVVLLVTGKPRAHDRASGEGRGAIAALVRDWLAASRHARHISAVRNAHPRHGGTGALYIILKS